MVFHSNSDLFRLLDANPSLLHHGRASTPSPTTSSTRRAFSPNFDVSETDAAYILEGELPGLVDRSKVTIEFTEAQTLLVRGKIERLYESDAAQHNTKRLKPTVEDESEESKELNKKEEGHKDFRPKYWVSERTVGEFQRTFSFPGYVDVDKVSATLAHGILKIVVPKRERPAGRRIEIH